MNEAGPFDAFEIEECFGIDREELDERHRDPRIGMAHVGDPVRLGTAIGFCMEPCSLAYRVVGIRRGPNNMRKFIMRRYRKGDGWFPTGDLVTTSSIGLVPWIPPDGWQLMQ